jgi:hypothetical protein
MQDLELERREKKDLKEQLKVLNDQAEKSPETKRESSAANGNSVDAESTAELIAKVAKLEKNIETWKVRKSLVSNLRLI